MIHLFIQCIICSFGNTKLLPLPEMRRAPGVRRGGWGYNAAPYRRWGRNRWSYDPYYVYDGFGLAPQPVVFQVDNPPTPPPVTPPSPPSVEVKKADYSAVLAGAAVFCLIVGVYLVVKK